MKLYSKKILYRKVTKYWDDTPVSVPYLIRYTLFTCKYFSIKIHKILISDTADLHDHPWNYISIILWGGYYEQTYHNINWARRGIDFKETKWHRPLSILRRKGDTFHRLIIPKDKIAISLIFTSYKWRKWGILTKDGWKEHKIGETY